MSSSCRSDYEDFGDEETRNLMAKYGRKLRTPRLPVVEAGDSQSLTASALSAHSATLGVSVPPVPPPPKKPPVPTAPRPRRVAAVAASAGMASRPSPSVASAASAVAAAASTRAASAPRRGSAEAGPPPRMSGPGAVPTALPPVLATPRGGGPSGTGAGEHEASAAAGAATPVGAGSGGAAAASSAAGAEGAEQETLGPHRSLMPRKETLRRKQQTLLKKTDVVFYRHHMRRHFQRILEAVESTFNDTTKKKKVNMNLSKPLTVTELRHLSPAGVRQP
mmetsp:Transcript_9878/g.27632  ORF Transcript_9878/g.27632 Transcript_9878/m.27632 type:complete len:278 (-) Transcript_9878:143-976(-)